MFTIIFACILLFHGMFHLLGFAKAYGILRLDQITRDITKSHGIVWLTVGVLFIICFFSFLWGEEWWKLLVITAILSQLLIINYWEDTKYATPINILIIAVSIMAYSTWSFNRDVEDRIKSYKVPNEQTELITFNLDSLRTMNS